MEIGFVSFDQGALNRANRVMKMLQGQGAIDELGLGRIRDAFSNTMFPGMSVLQTRAKYFLLMPALYAHLEKSPIADAREARQIIRENEIRLTRRLMEGSPKDATGIIGAEMLSRGEGYVKYDPTYVYQAGMETYGLIPAGGNVYATLVERSAICHATPKKLRDSDESCGDSDDLTGRRPAFRHSGVNYDFDSVTPLSMNLSRKEAEFLKSQIVKHTEGSLLSYLLDSGMYQRITPYYFNNLGESLKDIPQELFRTYRLALRFSRFAYLLRTRFAMLYDRAVGATEAAEKEEEQFHGFLMEHEDDFSPAAIAEIVRFVSPRVTEESCKAFIEMSARLIAEGKLGKLDREIAMRETTIKGLRRSKLHNAKDFEPGKPFESPVMMSFRWNTIVRTILTEIKEGMGDE